MQQIILNALGLKRKDFVMVKSFFLLLIYLFLLTRFSASLISSYLAIVFILAVFAYFREKNLVKQTSERFTDDNLFFRYGNRTSATIYPIRIPYEWETNEINTTINEMAEKIMERMTESIDRRVKYGKHLSEVIFAADSWKQSDNRSFLKFSYIATRGGSLTHFLNFQGIGTYIVVHFDTYMKGIPHWYEVLHFVLISPFRIWLWFIPWLRNDYSILAIVSKYLNNSFEEYDIESYFSASQNSILDTLRDYLKENNLLTDELAGVINYQLTYQNNYNNQVNVTGSNNNIAGSILQTVK